MFLKNLFARTLLAGLLMVSLVECKKEKEAAPESGNPTNSTISLKSITYNYIIKLTQTVVDGSTLNLPAGAIVGIEAGTRGPLLLKNFVGAQGSPITFINMNGKVTVKLNDSYSYGISTRGCKYIKFSGKGDPAIKYGLEVDGPHIGISFDQLTSDVELENSEVHNIGFAGIMAKTDPSCDPATWRGNFVMKNIFFHDNYVHHTGGEGFYVGNSFYSLGTTTTTCGTVFPHEISGLIIRNNLVQHTGCEGIQVGCAVSGCRVNNNTVQYYGESPFANYQNNGIQIGEGAGGSLYNNYISDGPGNGIIMLGLGDNLVFNNVIKNSGNDGIFCDSRPSTTGPGFKFINNSIINAGRFGITLYSETIPMNYVFNNAIANVQGGIYINKKSSLVKLTASNNHQTMDTTSLGFTYSKYYPCQTNATSPLVDAGADVTSYGVSIDFCNKRRPGGNIFDVGAYEYIPVVQ